MRHKLCLKGTSKNQCDRKRNIGAKGGTVGNTLNERNTCDPCNRA